MTVAYPYLPPDRTVRFVSEANLFMRVAKEYALAHSLDEHLKIGSVVVKDGKILGRGANGSDYHVRYGCERLRRGIPTGERYDLCQGCHPKNHSEPKAIADVKKNGYETREADLYLWGHWWCCQPCWSVMIEAGIRQVYLLKGSETVFNNKYREPTSRKNH